MKSRNAARSERFSGKSAGSRRARQRQVGSVQTDNGQKALIWIVTRRQAGALQDHLSGPMHLEPAEAAAACGTLASLADFGLGTEALYTASIVDDRRENCVQLFVAFMAVDEQDAANKLRARVGKRLAQIAQLSRGFDHSEPLALSLISDAAAHVLNDVADNPRSVLAAGLSIFIEHRFKPWNSLPAGHN